MRKILVIVDRDDPNNPTFARACAIAGENCADLEILRLRDARRLLPSAEPHDQFINLIAAARAHHPCIGAIAISAASHNANAIAVAAGVAEADLIVMRNTIDSAVPHDAPFTLIDHVVHRTSLPVLAVQNRADTPYRRLIALADRDAAARQAIELALQVKSAREIYALHASADAEAMDDDALSLERLVAAIKASRSDVSINIHPVTRAGDMSTALIRTWQDYGPDLVVAITRRRRGLRALLGPSHVRELLVDMPFDLLVQEAPPLAHRADRHSSPRGRPGKINGRATTARRCSTAYVA